MELQEPPDRVSLTPEEIRALLHPGEGEEAAPSPPAGVGLSGGRGDQPGGHRLGAAVRPIPPGPPGSQGAARSLSVTPARFAPLSAERRPDPGAPNDIELLMDVVVEVAAELGRARLQLREVLALSRGSVIELDKLAGSPADILVNGKLVARGEVVVIDDNFGVRVTELVSPSQRARARR